MMKLAELRDAIADSGWFLHNDLLCEVLHLNGYQTSEHHRFWRRLGARKGGFGHWTSAPDLSKFDSAHSFLLDDQTRVMAMGQPPRVVRSTSPPWLCRLEWAGPKLIYTGSGYGCSPGHALAAAWVDLQLVRSRPR